MRRGLRTGAAQPVTGARAYRAGDITRANGQQREPVLMRGLLTGRTRNFRFGDIRAPANSNRPGGGQRAAATGRTGNASPY